MRRAANVILSAAAAMLMAGCAPAPAPASEGQGVQQGTMSDEQVAAPDMAGPISPRPAPDAAACRASGGRIEARGRMRTKMCVHPYPDGGKACTDNLQCEGKCVAAVDDGPDGQVVGQCQADDALFGCYAEVVDSKLVRAICVD